MIGYGQIRREEVEDDSSIDVRLYELAIECDLRIGSLRQEMAARLNDVQRLDNEQALPMMSRAVALLALVFAGWLLAQFVFKGLLIWQVGATIFVSAALAVGLLFFDLDIEGEEDDQEEEELEAEGLDRFAYSDVPRGDAFTSRLDISKYGISPQDRPSDVGIAASLISRRFDHFVARARQQPYGETFDLDD